MSSKDSSNPAPSSEQPPEKKQKLEGDSSNDGDMVALKPIHCPHIPDFGVGFYYGRVTRINLDPVSRERLKPLCVAAMDYHNERKDTNYEFVELEKAKGQPYHTNIVLNVTMVGRIPEDGTTKMFEARVMWCKLENGRKFPFAVLFCREKASEGDGNDGDSDAYIDPFDYDESEDEVEKGSHCSERSMNDEEMEQYKVAVEASDGFDVPDFGDVMDCGRITPIHLGPSTIKRLKPLCECAIDWYNEKWGTNYEFVKLEKANMQGCCGIVYYLTFVGCIPNVDTTKSFEARVLLGIPEIARAFPITVYICREKASKGDVLAVVPLHLADSWVRIHDLPAGCMSLNIGKQLRNYISMFLDYDASNNFSFWKNYMRIKVRIDVCAPLHLKKKTFCTKTLDLVEVDVMREWGNRLRIPNRRSTNFGVWGGGGVVCGERWLRDEGTKMGGVANHKFVAGCGGSDGGIDNSSEIELDLVDDRKKKRCGLRVMQAQQKDMEVDSLTLQKSFDALSSGDGQIVNENTSAVLVPRSAGSHESYKLELLVAWEPTSSLSSKGAHSERRSWDTFSLRN
ncbi:hypothetical protein PTKIN_Ptkin19aG0072800 [Pterospermum kingtungense]